MRISASVHFILVSKWLGHSTFTLTLDVYGDYLPVPAVRLNANQGTRSRIGVHG